MGALAHPLEIDFLSNSGTRAVTAFATLELQTFWSNIFGRTLLRVLADFLSLEVRNLVHSLLQIHVQQQMFHRALCVRGAQMTLRDACLQSRRGGMHTKRHSWDVFVVCARLLIEMPQCLPLTAGDKPSGICCCVFPSPPLLLTCSCLSAERVTLRAFISLDQLCHLP